MGHKALYGDSQSHKAKEDAWEQLMAFDTAGSCILMQKDKKGNLIPVDITEGLKMANRSGHSAAEEQMTVLTRCMSCNKRVTTGATGQSCDQARKAASTSARSASRSSMRT